MSLETIWLIYLILSISEICNFYPAIRSMMHDAKLMMVSLPLMSTFLFLHYVPNRPSMAGFTDVYIDLRSLQGSVSVN
jgi:hypothetical protein